MDFAESLREQYPRKVVAPEKAISKIKRGSRVFIGTGCGEPQHLIHALMRDPQMQDIMIYQMLSITLSKYVDEPWFMHRFSIKLFFISAWMRKAAFEGKIDYLPVYMSKIPDLFYSRQIGLDVALIQVSPPDRFGFCSLGVSVDVTRSGIDNADLIIAQINPRMPRTMGEGFVHVDDIDYLVPFEEPLVEALPLISDNEVARRIGLFVSQLVNDGATIQVGFGHIPYAVLKHLENKNDLGVHTQMITDGFLPLLEQGVITNRKKSLLSGRTVSSLCMGSQRIYNYVDNNPAFYFRSSDFVNNPTVIARNDNLISISSALEVDLTGQVCTDSVGYLFYSGIGDQVDFLRGSAMSEGGFSIIALPSTAKNGTVTRIVPRLSEGAGVATTRGDINFVVTEYGIAELQGKSIYQRVMELAQIAHPDFRKELIEAAKTRRYIFGDQLPPPEDDLIFLERYKSTLTLKTGKTVEFRPLLPSDEFEYRNFFYSLRDDTIYYRFFHRKKDFTHEVVQRHWASIDYRDNISIIGLAQRKGHKQIVALGSYANANPPGSDRPKKWAEVAFVTREDFQGMGIASYLLGALEEIAKENGYRGFVASVLGQNAAMVRVFRKKYPGARIQSESGGELLIKMPFDAKDASLDDTDDVVA
ncbi:GNAT family N-acetyltransferase [Thermodesulfobacteriota bacterium]